MKDLRFEWDPDKARINEEKHGVSFEEASSVFFDGSAVEFYDDQNSEGSFGDRRFLSPRSER